MYQAGYFTIKKTEPDFLFVGLPNQEVKKAFAELVIEKLTNKDAIAVNDVYKDKISAALNNKDYTALKEEFNKILNEFSYESIVSFKEYAFRDVYKVMLQILGYNTYTEYQTALGRSDLCFEDEDKAQIREKRYGIRLTDKEVITLAIVIVNENASDKQKPMREVAAVKQVN